ncbi:MAG TPA: hypothetical protein VJN71_10850 [Nitrososphaerales archaeon]|nr:hypothetical protein [Nitrososphaerales archaeon]
MSQILTVSNEEPKKFRVKCDTCRVVQTYYTEVGVRYFKGQHTGHRVLGGPSEVEEIAESDPRAEISINSAGAASMQMLREPVETSRRETIPELTSVQVKQPRNSTLYSESGEAKKEVSKVKQDKITIKPSSSIDQTKALLLGKFAFVKDEKFYMDEAEKVSTVLKTFRWKIEPPYVIGALFDENLAIQSNTGIITREVIMGVEQLGYNFVAMESAKGLLTAWFKKEGAR